ncbi:MAG: hypothetical protein AB8C84_03635 [Oligoflexales bacterium]
MDKVGDELPVHEMIGQYVLELRGKGVCLPFQDYHIIQGWVRAAQGHNEQLLSLVEDRLSKYYEGKQDRPPSLKRVDASILKEIHSFF